jgi:hypothetical protein
MRAVRVTVLAAIMCVAKATPAPSQGFDVFSRFMEQAIAIEQERQRVERLRRDEDASRREQELLRLDDDRRRNAVRLEERRAEAERYAQQSLDFRAAAAEEASRGAAARLQAPARQLLEEASNFVKANRTHPRILVLLEQINALNSSLREMRSDKIEAGMKALNSELQKEPQFRKMLEERAAEERRQNALRLGEAIDEREKQKGFIVHYMTQQPTAPAVGELLRLFKDIEETLADNSDLARVSAITEKIDLALRRLGLRDEFVQWGSQPPKAEKSGPDTNLPNLLTEKNRFLIAGELDDFVILYNSAPEAPHVARNLRGEITFGAAQADACFYQTTIEPALPPTLRNALTPYNLRVMNLDARACPAPQMAKYDIVAVHRGTFLLEQPSYALMLLKEIERDRFKELKTITTSELKAQADADAAERVTIEKDIESGARPGFGIVIVDGTQSRNLCLAVADAEEAHRAILLRSTDQLIAELGFLPVMSRASTADDAFLGVQRRQCGAIYAASSDLKAILGGLRLNNIGLRISRVWSTPSQIEASLTGLAEAKAQEEKQELERRRYIEDQRNLEAHRNQEEAKKKEQRQKKLQEQNARAATAAAAEIGKSVRGGIDQPVTSTYESNPTLSQFPAFFSWYKAQLNDRWELLGFNSELVDYGVADFKGRKLNTAAAKVSVKLRNPILGEYKDACFLFGRMNDAEFKVEREPFVAPCNQLSAWAGWKRQRSFESRWLVE